MIALYRALILLMLFALTACGSGDSGEQHSAAPPQPFVLHAPGGAYRLDKTHASTAFSVRHLGLSNYIARFTDFDIALTLDAQALGRSAVSATIQSASVRTDYRGNYKATHPNSSFSTWDEDLARSDKFFNADQYPEIRFASTDVTDLGGGNLKVKGNLTLLGQTRPVTLDVAIIGSVAQHPFTKKGAIGLSARGTFKRSEFGMDHLVKPGFVGDEVTLLFEGEFHQHVTP